MCTAPSTTRGDEAVTEATRVRKFGHSKSLARARVLWFARAHRGNPYRRKRRHQTNPWPDPTPATVTTPDRDNAGLQKQPLAGATPGNYRKVRTFESSNLLGDVSTSTPARTPARNVAIPTGPVTSPRSTVAKSERRPVAASTRSAVVMPSTLREPTPVPPRVQARGFVESPHARLNARGAGLHAKTPARCPAGVSLRRWVRWLLARPGRSGFSALRSARPSQFVTRPTPGRAR